ncbi:MAG: PilZ domain-containing protein [Deltaproteobacteria bacterium]|nr:PilZ domain-containing protein [Deltaproteobacteria bacterium]
MTEVRFLKDRIVVTCKCPCGHSFPVAFERRRYPRKATDLGGAFIHDKRKTRGAIRVKNISLGGVGFELAGNYLLSTGDVVLLRFNLDDGLYTLIAKEAMVKKIMGNYVGSEFLGDIWKHDLLHLYLREE